MKIYYKTDLNDKTKRKEKLSKARKSFLPEFTKLTRVKNTVI